jgi:AAA15 family ATPase/GTPase
MKIGFTGTAGVGKSTLVDALDYLGLTRAVNIQRILNKHCQFPINKNGNALSQSAISAHYALEVLTTDNYITDRTVIDTFAYMFEGGLTSDEKTKIFNMYKSTIKEYDYLFYIPIEFEPPEDGVRVTDIGYRTIIDKHILDILKFQNTPFYTITGTVPERVQQIKEIINENNS